ncbi:MAG: acyltransferase [Rhodospirillales bacterium]|nr:acyltransferase [Rhodospirillales bacterium]
MTEFDFAKVGKNSRIFPSVIVINGENIVLGDNVFIDDFVVFNGGLKSRIGNNIHISSFTSIIGGGEFHVGDFSGFGAGCRFITGSDDFSGQSLANPTVPMEFRNVELAIITIGRHVLLGANCIALPNVTIGDGVIVSAGSIIDRDLEPWNIYVGTNPKRIRKRDKDKILALEAKYREEFQDT